LNPLPLEAYSIALPHWLEGIILGAVPEDLKPLAGLEYRCLVDASLIAHYVTTVMGVSTLSATTLDL
jgi:hypothetical protein